MAKIYWLWGLSGSGKTTLADKLSSHIGQMDMVERLDGDLVREFLTKDLGFSIDDRFKHIRRVAYVAKMLCRHGVNVICSFITPMRAMRIFLKDYLGDDLVLIYCASDISTCVKRDVKGLYRKGLYGDITQMTGLTSPFEDFNENGIYLDTQTKPADRSFGALVSYLEVECLIDSD